MDRRYEAILALLNGGAIVSGNHIACHLGVSVRTVIVSRKTLLWCVILDTTELLGAASCSVVRRYHRGINGYRSEDVR